MASIRQSYYINELVKKYAIYESVARGLIHYIGMNEVDNWLNSNNEELENLKPIDILKNRSGPHRLDRIFEIQEIFCDNKPTII